MIALRSTKCLLLVSSLSHQDSLFAFVVHMYVEFYRFFILRLFHIGSSVAFSASTSIATIGLYITQSNSPNSLPLSTNEMLKSNRA